MARVPNRYGGGAQTNANGLLFEQTTSLDVALGSMSIPWTQKVELFLPA